MAKVKVTCNWRRTSGCELSQNVRCELTHDNIFEKPELDALLGNEIAVLLEKFDTKGPCELHLKLEPSSYKIDSVSLASTSDKLELFQGPINEYTQTYYGESPEDIDNGEVFSFRHDIEIQKPGITELTLKLFTSSNEICIFGTLLRYSEFSLSIPHGVEPYMFNLKQIAGLEGKVANPPTACLAQVTCNWKRIGGCELSKSVRCEVTHDTFFIIPKLESILGNENGVLLKQVDTHDPCEYHLKLQSPIYKIESVSIISTSEKMEIFLGPLNEYMETCLAEPSKHIANVDSFRHDIEIKKSGVTELKLKLFKLEDQISDEICIFGTLLQIAPNPNGITTGLNFDFYKFLLSRPQKKGKGNTVCAAGGYTSIDMDLANKNQENAKETVVGSPVLDDELKTYLDNKFAQLECKLTQNLNMEITKQNAKLDKILHILENKRF